MASAARITRYTPEQYLEMERLTSLQEYVLVAQDEISVERFTRQGDDWVLSTFTSLDDTLRLASIYCEVSLREIYDKVEFSGEAGSA